VGNDAVAALARDVMRFGSGADAVAMVKLASAQVTFRATVMPS
jgi:hypothetical protein